MCHIYLYIYVFIYTCTFSFRLHKKTRTLFEPSQLERCFNENAGIPIWPMFAIVNDVVIASLVYIFLCGHNIVWRTALLKPFHSPVEHRPSTTPFHHTRFWASRSLHLCSAFDISASTSLRQVFLGLPLFLLS